MGVAGLWLVGRRSANWRRTLVTTAALAVAVSTTVSVQLLGRSVSQGFQALNSGALKTADLVVGGAGQNVPLEMLDAIATLPGVAHAAGLVDAQVQVAGTSETLMVLGVDFFGDTYFVQTDKGFPGDPLTLAASAGTMVFGQRFAQRQGLAEGATVTLQAGGVEHVAKVYGLLPGQDALAIAGMDTAQALAGLTNAVSRVNVAVKPGERGNVERRLVGVLGGCCLVHSDAQADLRTHSAGVLQRGLLLISWVALLVALVVAASATRLAYHQRRWELSVVRALGMTRKGMVMWVGAETAAMALVGSVLGVAAGGFEAGALAGVAQQMLKSSGVPVHVEAAFPTWDVALAGLAVGFVAAFVGVGSVLRQMRLLPPVQLLAASSGHTQQDGEIEHGRWLGGVTAGAVAWGLSGATWSNDSAVPVLVIALLAFAAVHSLTPAVAVLAHRAFVRVPAPIVARLGADAMRRMLRHTQGQLGALSAAILVAVAVGGYLDSLSAAVHQWTEQTYQGDLVVRGRANAALPHKVPDIVRQMPGVTAVLPWRIRDHVHNNLPMTLAAGSLTAWLRQMGRPEPAALPLERHAAPAAVSRGLAHRMGWAPGQMLELNAPAGAQRVVVVDVVDDYRSVAGTVFVEAPMYQRAWGDQTWSHLDVTLADDADQAQVVKALGAADLVAHPQRHLRQQTRALLADFLWFARLMLWLLVALCLMGTLTVVEAHALDHARELSLLRAVGASRRQTVALVLFQVAWMATVATVLGACGGVFAGRLILAGLMEQQTGFAVAWQWPVQTIMLTSLVTFVAAVFGALPVALRVTRGRPASALKGSGW